MRSFLRKHSNSAELTLLLLILVLIIGLALGLRSSANSRNGVSANSNTQRKGPSPPKRGVNYATFNHATHSSDCSSCHKVKEGERVNDFPGHKTCTGCHAFPAFSFPQFRSFCAGCHVATNYTKLKRFPDQRDNQFVINFPHNVHVGMDVKDYNPMVKVAFNEEEQKIQQISIKNGCISCHVKDGPEKKQTNFSKPHHPECAQCHGTEGKKVAPAMNDCAGCHQKPVKRAVVTNIVDNFRHDKDHERDIRPEAKSKAMLDCKFCHTKTVKAKKLIDVEPPETAKCIACHNEEVGARPLTSREMAKLKPSPPPAPGAKPTTKDLPVKPAANPNPAQPGDKEEKPQ